MITKNSINYLDNKWYFFDYFTKQKNKKTSL